MAARIIPTDPELSSYTLRATLDGREYQLALGWNQREAKWYLGVRTEAGVSVVAGLKVVANRPLLSRQRSPLAPPGEFFAMDRSGAGVDPGLRDLGRRVLLVYYDAADL